MFQGQCPLTRKECGVSHFFFCSICRWKRGVRKWCFRNKWEITRHLDTKTHRDAVACLVRGTNNHDDGEPLEDESMTNSVAKTGTSKDEKEWKDTKKNNTDDTRDSIFDWTQQDSSDLSVGEGGNVEMIGDSATEDCFIWLDSSKKVGYNFYDENKYSQHMQKKGKARMDNLTWITGHSEQQVRCREAALKGLAAEHAVASALGTSQLSCDDKCGQTKSNCLYTLLLTQISLKLPKAERNMLSAVLNHLSQTKMLCRGEPEKELYIPKTGAEMKNKLQDSKQSVMKNLVIPKMEVMDEGGYVYVSLADSLRVQFASDHPPNMFSVFGDSIHAQTPRGNELLAEFLHSDASREGPAVYPVKLVLWSDGFQCFNVTVNTAAAAHTCFATMGAKDGDMSGECVYEFFCC